MKQDERTMTMRKGIGFVVILFLPLLQSTRTHDDNAVQYYGFIGKLFYLFIMSGIYVVDNVMISLSAYLNKWGPIYTMYFG